MIPNSSVWQNFSVILDKIIRTLILFPVRCNKLEQEEMILSLTKEKCVSDSNLKAVLLYNTIEHSFHFFTVKTPTKNKGTP